MSGNVYTINITRHAGINNIKIDVTRIGSRIGVARTKGVRLSMTVAAVQHYSIQLVIDRCLGPGEMTVV